MLVSLCSKLLCTCRCVIISFVGNAAITSSIYTVPHLFRRHSGFTRFSQGHEPSLFMSGLAGSLESYCFLSRTSSFLRARIVP